ncbi:MAG: TIGR03086 family protein, partial [Nocardioidaceae bacterium]|nr:TIGR03086 family protein [Nocardioidaceae bacterium]
MAGTEQLIAAVRREQWPQRTACTDWTVRDLVNHLVGGDRLFASVLSDEAPPVGNFQRPQNNDQLGDSPVTAYRGAAGALLAAFRQPGVLEKIITVPAGTMPGRVAVHLRLTETLVHGWDLARANGDAVPYRDDIAEQELAFTRAQLGKVPPGRRPFAPPQPAAEEAPA